MTGVSFFGHPLVGQTDAGGAAGRHARRRGDHLLRVHRLRLGLDARRGSEEPERATCRSASSRRSLICTVLYIAVVAVLTGMVSYDKLSVDAGVSDAFKQAGPAVGRVHHRGGGRRRHHVGAAGDDAVGAARVPGHGARRHGAAELLRRRPPEVPDAVEVHDPDRRLRRRSLTGFLPIDALLHMTNIGTLFAS